MDIQGTKRIKIKIVTAKKYLGLIAAILANDSTAKTAVKK